MQTPIVGQLAEVLRLWTRSESIRKVRAIQIAEASPQGFGARSVLLPRGSGGSGSFLGPGVFLTETASFHF